jgi:hypothetical protein
VSTFDIVVYRELLRAARNAESVDEKGASLEKLLQYLLNSVPGITVYATDVRTLAEEIDLVAFNQKQDQAFSTWDSVVFVECKNWKEPVGKTDVIAFLDKLRSKGLRFGLLVARLGVTGDARGRRDSKLRIREAMSDGFRIIVLTLEDLEGVKDPEDFSQLVLEKLCGLFVDRF